VVILVHFTEITVNFHMPVLFKDVVKHIVSCSFAFYVHLLNLIVNVNFDKK